MPLGPRQVASAGLTMKWPSARRVIPLLLCLCLRWLWAGTPVAAQDPIPPPAVETTGPYRNLAENHAGAFHLRREEGVVYATFRTDRSPVQFLVRDQPDALLTVPQGFRPPVDITWEVSAQPVQADGTPSPDSSDHRVFRMRVDTAGQVRYVDDPSVDGVGYFRYRTALAWPLAGTDPQVCGRHQNIREGILAAVQVLEDAAVPCSQVNWTRLARIRALSLDTSSANFARHDLLGLTNLTALQVSSSWVILPADLLAHTPRLQTLQLDGWDEALPGDLFWYTPRLSHLTLGNNPRRPRQDLALPGDLLAHTPHLESLHLEGRHPVELARQLLARTPYLTRLTVTPSTPLPETFLAAVPQLTRLTVRDGLALCTTPQLLAPVPHLRHFAVHMSAEDGELACLGRALRLHTPDLSDLHVELQDLQNLDTKVLPNLPRLTRLTLDVTDLTSLPAPLLAEASALTHLALHGGTLTLPPDFLAHTPRLTDLSLQVDFLKDLPPDLLAPVTELRQLQLDTGNATYLPARFLERVTELRVDSGWLALPADFLMQAPRLEVLHLDAALLESFPEGFLTYAPRLVELHLRVPELQALPPTFLANAPRLEVVHLNTSEYSYGLEYLPEGFLTHAPRLVEFYLLAPGLGSLPTSFLGSTPRLEKLELGHGYAFSPPYPRVKLPVRSLPANFLTHVPRLRHLDLASLGGVTEFPPGFLAHAPQLRYLNLDANGAEALPTGFLARHPHLETIRLRAKSISALPQGFLGQSPHLMDLKLDLQRVEALPEGFLADTPRLRTLEIDVHRVEALTPGFLAHAPHLASLNLRTRNLTALPPDFLAHVPRIQTLGLAMPLLEPTLTPDHRLWDTLQAASHRVKVIRPDPFYFEVPNPHGMECGGTAIKLGDILEVKGRAPDDHGHTLLRLFGWEDRELFATKLNYNCLYLIDARFTVPTLEVCATDQDSDECVPIAERYGNPPVIYGGRGHHSGLGPGPL